MFLCKIEDIAESGARGFKINAERLVFAVKKDGEIFVYENSCPHLGIPLEMLPDQFLDLDKQFIQCSTHGALFQIESGLCIAGPCSGASLRVQAFQVKGDELHLID